MIIYNMEYVIVYGNCFVMFYYGKIVVDVKGEVKRNLIVVELMEFFYKNLG